ncbi:MAG: ABC transporter permease [Anaerolineae bacterium]|nr:ABC transporter permease [Thermoflexales bacterium]MDW8396482.1 ABC transporter permease [Anaerolineae bacterium]
MIRRWFWLGSAWPAVASVLMALALAALVMVITGSDPLAAYGALFQGAFLRPGTATRPTAFFETLVSATPYLILALGISIGFAAGLFNIGAEGQLYMGALASVSVGFLVKGLPWFVHLPLAIAAGVLAGVIWAGIAGWLKATRDAPEVVTTIMLNYIAYAVVNYMVNGPLRHTGTAPRTPDIEPSAVLPTLLPPPERLHWGLILAIACAVGYYLLMNRSALGLQIRLVGENRHAARYAGINVNGTYLIAMVLSGALCGLAGAVEVLALYRYLPTEFTVGYGFDSIAVALLGQGNPIGIALAALLFGAMANGSGFMQFSAGVSNYIIAVVQAFIIVFVAAPGIARDVLVNWWARRIRRKPAAQGGEA